METTPNWRRDQESPKSSLLFAAHARMYEKKMRTRTSPLASCPSTVSSLPPNTFAMLPRYCSSSKRSKNTVSVNPFACSTGLAEKLMGPACSPDVFTNIKSPTECTEFHWTIEDISKINPAKIDSPLYQIDEVVDEETESQAQEAIQLYFSKLHNIPSPLVEAGTWVSMSGTSTPEAGVFNVDSANAAPELLMRAVSTPCSKMSERRLHRPVDAGTQTTLSLPPVLPDELQAILEPYMMNAKDESMIQDENNTSSNTLRRKLFFHSEDEPISPVKCNYLDEEWRLKGAKGTIRQGWTPNRDLNLDNSFPSTPEISPIKMSSSDPTSENKRRMEDGLEPDDQDVMETTSVRQRLDFTRELDIDLSSQAISYMESSDLGRDFKSEGRNRVDSESAFVMHDPEEISQPSDVIEDEERGIVRPMFSSTIVGGGGGDGISARPDIFTSTVINGRLHQSKSQDFQESKSDTGYQTMPCCCSSSLCSGCYSSMFERSPIKGKKPKCEFGNSIQQRHQVM